MPACLRIQAPGSLGRAGPEVDHRNPLHKGGFHLRRRGPQAPGLAQRWTTGILSTRGVLSSGGNEVFDPEASVAAPAPQAPGPRLPGVLAQARGGGAGALHRLFRRFERARSGFRATETSGIPGSKNPDFPLKTAHRQTDRQTEDKPAHRTPLPRRKFTSRVRALPPAPIISLKPPSYARGGGRTCRSTGMCSPPCLLLPRLQVCFAGAGGHRRKRVYCRERRCRAGGSDTFCLDAARTG
eukprot:gene22833-biopygen14821